MKVECASSGGTDRNFSNTEIHFSCVGKTAGICIVEITCFVFRWQLGKPSCQKYDLVAVVKSNVAIICLDLMESEFCTSVITYHYIKWVARIYK